MGRPVWATPVLDRLVAAGRAEWKPRGYLWVYDKASLTPEEARAVAAADARRKELARARGDRTKLPSRQDRARAHARQRAMTIQANKKARKAKARYGQHIEVAAPQDYERWQKVAWREARREFRAPTYAAARAARVIGWLTGFTALIAVGKLGYEASGWIHLIAAGAAGWLGWKLSVLVVELAVYRPYRRRVNSRAIELLEIFEEARARSRRIPYAIRAAVLARQPGCAYCGATEGLHIDHIHPHSRGGLSVLENLQTLCAPCNIRKGARPDAEARRIRRAAASKGTGRRAAPKSTRGPVTGDGDGPA